MNKGFFKLQLFAIILACSTVQQTVLAQSSSKLKKATLSYVDLSDIAKIKANPINSKTAKLKAEKIGIFYNQSLPQVEFAASEIKAALENQNIEIELLPVSKLSAKYKNEKIVITLKSNTSAINLLNKEGGNSNKIDVLGEQGYALRVSWISKAPFLWNADQNSVLKNMNSGKYVFEFTAADNEGNKAEKLIQITIKQDP